MTSFTPNDTKTSTYAPRENTGLFPVPKSGSRKARVSLIVDLGVQKREDIYKDAAGKQVDADTPGATAFPQKPSQQVAVFVDLVNDVVDYGGDIGKTHYRAMLNGSFGGKLKGINFQRTPPRDASGKIIEGRPNCLHALNMLSKLAIAVGKPEIIESADIGGLLNEQLMITMTVTEKDSGKKDPDGKPIIYRNVIAKSPTQVSLVESDDLDEDGNPIEVMPTFPPLKTEARCITFTNATKDDIKYLRGIVLKTIKQATDYEKSAMRKAVEAYEAERGDSTPAPAKAAEPKPEAKPKPVATKAPVDDDDDSDAPF